MGEIRGIQRYPEDWIPPSLEIQGNGKLEVMSQPSRSLARREEGSKGAKHKAGARMCKLEKLREGSSKLICTASSITASKGIQITSTYPIWQQSYNLA